MRLLSRLVVWLESGRPSTVVTPEQHRREKSMLKSVGELQEVIDRRLDTLKAQARVLGKEYTP